MNAVFCQQYKNEELRQIFTSFLQAMNCLQSFVGFAGVWRVVGDGKILLSFL